MMTGCLQIQAWWTMIVAMINEANEGQFPGTSGEVPSIAVQVDYAPRLPLPSVAGHWVGTRSHAVPGNATAGVVFSLLLRQDGSRVSGTTMECSGPERATGTTLIADLSGKVSDLGVLVVTKVYRDRPDLPPVIYQGQLSTDLRAVGGNWHQQPEYGLSGTFVMRRVTMGLDAKQW
jgi:hypothetical protein